MVPMGPGDGPGRVYIKAVHAQEVDKDLEDPDVGDRGKDKRDKEDGIEHDGRGEQQRLVNGKAHGNDGGLYRRWRASPTWPKQNIKTRQSVAPVPPMQTTKYWAPRVNKGSADRPERSRCRFPLGNEGGGDGGSTRSRPGRPQPEELMAPWITTRWPSAVNRGLELWTPRAEAKRQRGRRCQRPKRR